MDCCEFREKYSDFADGLLTAAAEARARQHLVLCASCRRFDAALRAGLSALRELPQVSVSRSFGERLRRRLRWELAVRMPVIDRWSGAVGALLLVVTVGFIAFDLMEGHGLGGARHAMPVLASSTPRLGSHLQTVALISTVDTTIPPLDTPHPFQPIMIEADTGSAPYPAHLRFDVPAVWGGR
jgi:anti-sigma factor RsiW